MRGPRLTAACATAVRAAGARNRPPDNKPRAHTLSLHVRGLHGSFQVVSGSVWGRVITLQWRMLFHVFDEIGYITQHRFPSLAVGIALHGGMLYSGSLESLS